MSDRDFEFDLWMQKIDDILDDRLGLTHNDLPDYCYTDAFDAGDSPEVTVDNVLENAGF